MQHDWNNYLYTFQYLLECLVACTWNFCPPFQLGSILELFPYLPASILIHCLCYYMHAHSPVHETLGINSWHSWHECPKVCKKSTHHSQSSLDIWQDLYTCIHTHTGNGCKTTLAMQLLLVSRNLPAETFRVQYISQRRSILEEINKVCGQYCLLCDLKSLCMCGI